MLKAIENLCPGGSSGVIRMPKLMHHRARRLRNLQYLELPRALEPRNLQYLVHARALGPRNLQYSVHS